MTRYKKKPIEVEAFRLFVEEPPEWFNDWLKHKYFEVRHSYDRDRRLLIVPGEYVTAHDGDYIILGVEGEVYPCNPGIFEKTYEKLN
ncbi:MULTISPECIES: hypothetical protein [Bacillus amyloliquefaciens group]|uniref:hypothetical protein n=1 Tax=Bacillus amyloliquefaciens group TaxID=1938374 RepID=UPI000B517C0E|nr:MULTISPECIES: hypothetical protein [Bacillus amyloliquefaciens group]ASB54534.1 hypothetical protein S100072_03228 [Bacillus velezensis]ASF30036.1 hypothetical protein WV34_15260 [Bacillus amyloliquefaciens]QMT24080.1 hypothetical protein H2N97_16385 [Bacillus velezensis]UZD73458.1 hypothetical protein OM992_17085 [Bacillus siamensis]WJN54054.1 hypothetical protein QTN52_16505 [Bacillus velezensis]